MHCPLAFKSPGNSMEEKWMDINNMLHTYYGYTSVVTTDRINLRSKTKVVDDIKFLESWKNALPSQDDHEWLINNWIDKLRKGLLLSWSHEVQ